MKNYLLLLIIPFVFIIYSFALKNADSPNYNYGMADPSYVYLLNSLSMSNLEGSGHTDHPGTPLQVTGAVILKIYFALSHEKDNITEDVIYRPEAYLRVFDHTLIFLNAGGLFLAGLLIFFVFKNILAGLIFQTVPFVSINIIEVFSLIKTENFAFFLMLLQIALMVRYVYDQDSDGKKYYLYASGVLCGLILTVKVSFLCIVILPLIIIPGFRNKLILILMMFLIFILAVLPVISNMGYFISWITKLFIHNGRYGNGDSTVINSSEFFSNIRKIISNERFFVFTWILLLSVIVTLIVKKNKSDIKEIISSKESKLCYAIFFAMSLHVLMVAKHYSSRYMFPALLLSVPALFISASIFYRIYLRKLGMNFLYAGLLGFLLLFGIYNGRKQLARSNMIKAECQKLTEFINENYSDASEFLSPGISSQSAALIFSYYYSSEKSRNELKKYINRRFPGVYWYDVFNEKLIRFSAENPAKDAEDVSGENKTELYRTTDGNYNEAFIRNYEKLFNKQNVKLTELFSNDNGELIYRIDK